MRVKISVVIPAYNEDKTIVDVLEKLKTIFQTISQPYEIILINDGSSDDTGRKARACGVKVIDHKDNLGYGRSLKDGIRASCGELILLIDADGTYDIDEIPNMLHLAKDADLVIGKRIFAQGKRDYFKDLTRKFFAYLTSYYSGRKVEDLNSGQRIFRRHDLIDILDTFPDGFSFTSTMTALYIRRKKTIVYTPIKYKHRNKESKFILPFNIYAIAKLAFTLVMKRRPLKASAQLGVIFIGAALLSKAAGFGLHATFFVSFLFFVVFYLFFFFLFLCYVYARGKAVT